MSGSNLCINETVQPPYFQNRIIMFCLTIPTLIYLWEIYLFPGSVCLFCCSKICGQKILGIYRVQCLHTHECWNLDWAAQFPEKEYTNGIFIVVHQQVMYTVVYFIYRLVLGTMLSWYTNRVRYWLEYVFGKSESWCHTVINARWNHPDITLLVFRRRFFYCFL